MNLARIATRVARQSPTAVPVQHDMAVPLFESEEHEADLERLSELASNLVEGVNSYLETQLQGLEGTSSVMSGELEMLEQHRPEHLEAICDMLLERALGTDEDEEEGLEEDPSTMSDEVEESEEPEAFEDQE